jgi:cell division protein FtsL
MNRTRLDRTYRLLRRAWGPTPGVRDAVVVMVALASLLTLLALAHVSRRHEVIRAGYELSKATQRLEALREQRRALEVERATLTHPERLRGLATRMGMVPAQPAQIRVVAATATEAADE